MRIFEVPISAVATLGLLSVTLGCGGEAEPATSASTPGMPSTSVLPTGNGMDVGAGPAGTPTVGTAGSQAPVPPPVITDGPVAPMVGPPPTAGGPLSAQAGSEEAFCQVRQAVTDNCGLCHGAQPAFGAPMSLLTHADMVANSPVDGRPNYMVMLDRIKDDVRPMPPSPNARLTTEHTATMEAWVAAGAPDSAACEEPAVPAQNPADCIDCGTYSCDASKGTPLQVLAHGQPTPGDTTAYDASRVGADGNPDLYQCFYFKAPWADGAQSLGYKPIIDNKRVLHHWLMYASDQAPADMTDGGMTGRCQAQGDPNRILLAGWAPGTPGINLPEGVGQQLPSGSRAYVTLEIHYYNTDSGTPADDRSGVELCMANEPQPNVATQHWLGTEKIAIPPGGMSSSADTCTPQGQTSTIISITPHMHKAGRHSKMEVIRAGGQVETILDEPFQFDNQTTHVLPQPVVINAGDQLRTTCDFENTTAGTVGYGEGSDEEMCYLFTTAYPAGSLHNGKSGCALGLCIPGGITRCIDNENILDAVGAL